MLRLRALVLGLASIALTFGREGPAGAQDAGARPVIVMSGTPTDPQKLAWIGDDARKALGDEIAAHKAGTLAAFVFVAAAGGVWDGRTAAKPGDFASIEDLARIALQTCEFWHHVPCTIVSINGNDAVDATGTYPVQPRLLDDHPRSFEVSRIPFISADYQSQAAGYATMAGQRAFVVSPSDTFTWQSGKTAFDAIAAAYAACQKQDPSQLCLLYAVNSRVVFVPGDY